MPFKHFVRWVQAFGTFMALICMTYWVLTRFALFLILGLVCLLIVLSLFAAHE